MDLFNSIETGDFPKFVLYIQAISADDTMFIEALPFDILDATKEWPINLIPLREVGMLEFNRNPKDQFMENEQIAFAPGRLIPGIEPSDDKLLQGRLVAYADAQRYRLGTNFQLLPVNAPQCPYYNGNVDGFMNFEMSGTRVINYFPSLVSKANQSSPNNPEIAKETTTSIHFGRDAKSAYTAEAPKFHHEEQELLTGTKLRHSIPPCDADYTQAGDRYRAFDEQRKDRFAERIAFTLTEPGITDVIISIWVDFHWNNVDPGLSQKIRKFMALHKTQKDIQPDPKLAERRAAFEKANGGPMPLPITHNTIEKVESKDSGLAAFSASH